MPAVNIDGKILGQAGAILQYVADKYPEFGAGDGELARFEFNEVMNFLTGDFHPAFWPYFVPSRFTVSKDEEQIEAVRQASFARIDRVLTHLDSLIGDGVHVYQDKRTVADAYAFVMVRWAGKLEKSWEQYPNVARFMQAMNDDEAVKYVLQNS
ncbi:MAG: glutathione binding-like protein [Moraxella equi]|nr:glutathione binding-like protein [Moraxella equi]